MAVIGDFVERIAPVAPEAKGAEVFDRFQAEPDVLALAVVVDDGRPLGLAICRQIVERMDGRIGLETADAGGARFWFELPLERSGPEVAAAQAEIAPPTAHATVHVLIADDNATNRFVAGKLLETFGCTHESVEDGARAVEAVREKPFDLVLMDIKMPGMDGLQATAAIRALSGPRRGVPIIALTANADPRDAEAYRAAGMAAVVEKPIRPDALLDAMRRVLSDEASEQTLAA